MVRTLGPDSGPISLEPTTTPSAANWRGAAAHIESRAGRFALALRYRHHFARIDVNQPRADLHHGFRSLLAEISQPDLARVLCPNAARAYARIVASKLGDRTDYDRFYARHAADLGGRVRIGAIAIREILLGQNLVERLALVH